MYVIFLPWEQSFLVFVWNVSYLYWPTVSGLWGVGVICWVSGIDHQPYQLPTYVFRYFCAVDAAAIGLFGTVNQSDFVTWMWIVPYDFLKLYWNFLALAHYVSKTTACPVIKFGWDEGVKRERQFDFRGWILFYWINWIWIFCQRYKPW